MTQLKNSAYLDVVKSLLRGLLTLAVVAYVFYTIGLSVYRNYQVNQEIESLRQDIGKLKSEIAELNNLLIYYQSDGFKEIEARRRLGLKAPGEQVIILPEKEKRVESESQTTNQSNLKSSENSQVSNPVKWFNYIFKQ